MVDVAEAEMENSLDPDYVSKMGAAKDTLANCKYRVEKKGNRLCIPFKLTFSPQILLTTNNVINRKEMCDVKKIHICEIMGLVNIFRKNKMRRPPLAKNHSVSANLWVDISTGLL